MCIPNRLVLVRDREPSWFTNELRKLLRKQLYRKAKNLNTPYHWDDFRKLRNNIISKIRDAKSKHTDSLSKKTVIRNTN